MVLVAALGCGAATSWHGASASFSGRTTNANDTFTAAATFPNYASSIASDSPILYHRLDDTVSSASTSTVADSSGGFHPATFNGRTDGPSTWWKFDENTGTSVMDSAGGADLGTFRNGTAWSSSGKYGSAGSFDGLDDSVDGSGPSVATDSSFSVSAWAYLTSTGGGTAKAVVSQDGTNTSGYVLGYDPGTSRWRFALPTSDVAAPTVDAATSTAAPTLNAWTQLIGVYDSTANSLKLYVNGVAQTAGTHSSAWNAPGVLAVGRARSAAADSSWFPGRIDDVRTYRRALAASDITSGFGDRPDVDWELDEGSGTSVADSGNDGVAGTVGGSASWNASGHSGSALTFNGSTSYVGGSGPAVTTSSSFTVSAWVKLASTGTTMTAVSQDASVVSGFWLQYDGTANKWSMTTRDTDSQIAPLHQAMSTSTPVAGTWTHLVGVWDATTPGSDIRLYVNGTEEGSNAAPQVTNATGALQLGRGKASSAYGTYWSGSIDQVRLYSRALSDSEIAAIYAGGEAGNAMSAGQPGALGGTLASSTAVSFGGTTGTYNPQSFPNPNTFTDECWFKAAGTQGGALLGFSDQKTGASANTDRVIYLDSGGQLAYGVRPGGVYQTIRSPATYNDGAWHQVAASLGSGGMKLYVDGALVASNAAVTTGANFSGFSRIGGVSLLGWPNRPVSDYFIGTIDEVSVFLSQLSDSAISIHYNARNR